MQLGQNFTVKQNGAVRGGTASYTADSITGTIGYAANVSVGFWPIVQTENEKGGYTCDPTKFLSNQFKLPGDTVTVGPLSLQALTVANGQVLAKATITGQPGITGTATLDNSGTYLKVLKLIVNAKVGIFSLTIEADAAPSSFFARLKHLFTR